MIGERKTLPWFCLLVAAGLGLYYWPWLSGQWCFYASDHTYYFEPLTRFIADAASHGRLALWNPYSFCGMSQIAIPSPNIFYPPTALFVWLPYSQALAAYLLLHQVVAGLGGFLLIRSWGWGPISAGVCGLILAFCGYMFSLPSNSTLVATAAWLPLCLWSLRKIHGGTDGANLRQIILAALCAFMLAAAGRPELSVPSVLLMVAYIGGAGIVSYNLDRLGHRATYTFMWRLYAIATGLLLAMPIILPALEWARLSPRGHGLQASEIFLWSANWYDWLCLVLAQPLGDLYAFGNKFLNIAASRPAFIPFLASAFVGPVACTLALWGLLDNSWRGRPLLFLVLIPSVVMILGQFTPLAPWIVSSWPLLAIFRYPIKLMIIPVWCISLMAARGTYRCLERGPGLLAEVSAFIFWLTALVISTALALSPELGWLFNRLANPSLLKEATHLLGVAGLKASAVGLATCAVGFLLRSGRVNRKVFAALVLPGLAASMLSCAFLYTRHGTEPKFFLHPSYIADKLQPLLKQQPAQTGFRIAHLYLDPLAQPPWYQGENGENREARFYQYGRQLLLPNTFIDFNVCASDGYEAAETDNFRRLYWGCLRRSAAHDSKRHGQSEVSGSNSDVPFARFCQMTSTGFVLTQVFRTQGRDVAKLDTAHFELVMEDSRMNVRLYRVNAPLARLYACRSALVEDSADSARLRMVRAELSGFDPAKQTLFNKMDLPPNLPELTGQTELKFRVLSDDPEHESWQVQLSKPAIVIVSDQYYPGWGARLDGQPAHIYPANVVQRSVVVPAGTHTLNFDYQPESLAAGLLLALLGLILVLSLLCMSVVRTLKTPSQRQKLDIMNKWQ